MLVESAMLILNSAAEPPPDPTWLRALATLLPFLGPVVVALIAAPWVVDRLRGRKGVDSQHEAPKEQEPAVPPGSPLPGPLITEAHTRAEADPLLRLLIEDLHNRLSEAHRDAAMMHNARAEDAAQIARLTAELDDQEQRYRQVLAELDDKSTQLRLIRPRLEELKRELEATKRKLAICMEGYRVE